jgi:hypothetical protein
MKIYYKIVEKKDEKFLTLFHGIGGTRVMPVNQWITAEIKDNVMDGKGTTYTSGLHIIDGYENALDYMSRFRRTDRVIVSCYAENLRHKTKSKPYVFLADKIMLIKEISNGTE